MAPALRILLAEDNAGDVFLVREALNRHCADFELTVANDGKRAWELIEAAESNQRRAFTFFLLDLNLPARPGLELLMKIRRSVVMSSAPVVIVTSSDAASDRMLVEKSGADYYFCKPSRLEKFLELGSIVQTLWVEHMGRIQENSDSRTDKPKETYE